MEVSAKLPKRVIFIGLLKSWLACLPFIAVLTIFLAAGVQDFKAGFVDVMRLALIGFVFGMLLSFIVVFIVGYIVFIILEKQKLRLKRHYIIGGAIGGLVTFPVFIPLAILASYVFWKTVIEKYLIKGQVYDRANS